MGPSYRRIFGMSLLAIAMQWGFVIAVSAVTGHHHTLFGMPF